VNVDDVGIERKQRHPASISARQPATSPKRERGLMSLRPASGTIRLHPRERFPP
jgi:hypothetical protein